jgi:hypothetical protein
MAGGGSGSGGAMDAGDASTKPDVAPDTTSAPDADAGGSADADATTPGADADANAAEADAASTLTIDKFQHAQSLAWCQRLSECCALGDKFDMNHCVTFWDVNYGPDNIAGYLQQYGTAWAGIHVVFDPVQANECLNLLRTKDCATQTGADKRNVYATCVTAAQGSLGLNVSGCRTSLECAGGLYCFDSTCRALKTQDAVCSDPDYSGDQCNYLGVTTASSLHCAPAGATGDTGKCSAGLGLASSCTVDQECASGVCSTISGTCVTSQPLGAPFCSQFTKPDGG